MPNTSFAYALALVDVTTLQSILLSNPAAMDELTLDILIQPLETTNTSLLFLLSTSKSGMEILDDILQHENNLIKKVNVKTFFQLCDEPQQEYHNTSTFFLWAISNNDSLLGVLSDNLGLLKQITPAILYTAPAQSDKYADLTAFYGFTQSDAGVDLLLDMFELQEHLLSNMPPEALFNMMPDDSNALYNLCESPEGILVLEKIAYNNTWLLKNINIELLFELIAGAKKETLPGLVTFVSALLSQRPDLVNRLPAKALYADPKTTKFFATRSVIFKLAQISEGQQLLHMLFTTRPSLANDIPPEIWICESNGHSVASNLIKMGNTLIVNMLSEPIKETFEQARKKLAVLSPENLNRQFTLEQGQLIIQLMENFNADNLSLLLKNPDFELLMFEPLFHDKPLSLHHYILASQDCIDALQDFLLTPENMDLITPRFLYQHVTEEGYDLSNGSLLFLLSESPEFYPNLTRLLQRPDIISTSLGNAICRVVTPGTELYNAISPLWNFSDDKEGSLILLNLLTQNPVLAPFFTKEALCHPLNNEESSNTNVTSLRRLSTHVTGVRLLEVLFIENPDLMQQITENELFLAAIYDGAAIYASPFQLLGTRIFGVDLLCKWIDANPDLFKKIPGDFIYEYAYDLNISVLDFLAKSNPKFLERLLIEHPNLAQEIPAQAWIAHNNFLKKSPVLSLIANKSEYIFKLLPPEVQNVISESQNTVGSNPASFFGSSASQDLEQNKKTNFNTVTTAFF